jgi:hypothetical protein
MEGRSDGWGGCGEGGAGGKEEHGDMKVPEAVEHILREGEALRWDADTNCYEVLDADLYVRRFNALRAKRVRREDGAPDRPFAAMRRYFKLQSGDGWGKLGAKFSLLPPTRNGKADRGNEAVAHEAREQPCKRPKPKPGKNWFSSDVKCCAECGRGTATVEQRSCADCGGSEWNFAGVSALATAGMQSEFIHFLQTINGSLGFEGEDDVIVMGDLSEEDIGLAAAQAVLNSMVEKARASEGELGCRWDLRSLHLGKGICVDKTRADVLRAFLLWSQTEEDQHNARFNVSKAFRRMGNFVLWCEKFEKFLQEPLTLDDPAFSIAAAANPVLAPWHTPGGTLLEVSGLVDVGSMCAAARELYAHGAEHCDRVMVRYVFTQTMAMMFDDAMTKRGMVCVALLDRCLCERACECACLGECECE